MAKGKRGKLLITYQEGDPSHCGCGKRPEMIVHHSIDYLDLRDFHDEDFTKELQRVLRKAYPREAMERFLCKGCWDAQWYNNDDHYEGDGQADFTSMFIRDWRKREWFRTEDAVARVIKTGHV